MDQYKGNFCKSWMPPFSYYLWWYKATKFLPLCYRKLFVKFLAIRDFIHLKIIHRIPIFNCILNVIYGEQKKRVISYDIALNLPYRRFESFQHGEGVVWFIPLGIAWSATGPRKGNQQQSYLLGFQNLQIFPKDGVDI